MLSGVGDQGLWVEFAAGNGIPVLLISGADSPCSHWPDELVTGLTNPVIRFDHRDVGRSRPAAVAYGLDDLVNDTIGVLDLMSVERAHIIGSSLGGMIGQKLALARPERLATLTILISSPDPQRSRLSPPRADWEEAATDLLFAVPPRTHEEKADRTVAMAQLYAGTRDPFAEDAIRRRALEELSAGWPDESGHALALASADPWLDELDRISTPTLVVHGDSDPLFGLDHGEALAAGIPDADLLTLEGLGHEITAESIADIMPKLLAHLEENQ
jgi:pimeloyl-ACP methyl ester carboxylesterase